MITRFGHVTSTCHVIASVYRRAGPFSIGVPLFAENQVLCTDIIFGGVYRL